MPCYRAPIGGRGQGFGNVRAEARTLRAGVRTFIELLAWFGHWDGGGDGVEEVADALAVFGGDGEDVAEAELAEVFRIGGHGVAFGLVDGEEDGLAAAEEHADEVVVGAGELGADVDDEDEGVGFVEGDAGPGGRFPGE